MQMYAESQSPDRPSPMSHDSGIGEPTLERIQSKSNSKATATQVGAPVPLSKTDKPKPHICQTCTRGFARLEHLKRHERSHTKEKPFECPECNRCFARRDLLLRHQQKLHSQNNTVSRPRNGRRESVSATTGTSTGRVRKNSIVNSAVGGSGGVGQAAARPRANTLGHIDLSSLALADADGMPAAQSWSSVLGLKHTPHRFSMGGVSHPRNLDYQGLPVGLEQQGYINAHSKLDSQVGRHDSLGAPRTAPPYSIGFGGFDLDQLFSPGNTINPAQLHFGGLSAPSPTTSLHTFPPNPFLSSMETIEQDDDFGWMRGWDNAQMLADASNEHAIDESSSSRISSNASQSGLSEAVMELQGGGQQLGWLGIDHFSPQAQLTPATFQLDSLGSGLPDLDASHDAKLNQTSPDSKLMSDNYFSKNIILDGTTPYVPPSLSNFSSDSPSMSSSITGSARQSSVTSISTESITDATRQALLISLSQPSVFGHNHRKYSQPSISSPLSPSGAVRAVPSLPSTSDLQRYVNSYIQYFHPHLPFLHVATLSFNSSDYISNLRSSGMPTSFGHAGIIGGGGCLILAMAAIGALYEYDHQASKELFDSAKKMIQLYLEERRKADMSAAVSGSFVGSGNSSHNTPLWLVQAMLLNVIYGHHCGDKTAADIASTHCAALVSLARAAELAQPMTEYHDFDGNSFDTVHRYDESDGDGKLQDDHTSYSNMPLSPQQQAAHASWSRWKEMEERKRTLFAVFILSSLLVTAYNHTPAIMNSEILLDLPCEEDLWAAENAQEWLSRGGSQAADSSGLPFANALSTLLTANQRPTSNHNGHASGDAQNQPELRPSTFGCLVLINALHNYIWETRTRHHGKQWTTQETESMFSHIEPALNAWQTAWKANDHHRLQRPNLFGLGPLSADSIPLLDLAFVRLFVNLGRSKEAFWQRDFEAMANELARGIETVQYVETSSTTVSGRRISNANEALNGMQSMAAPPHQPLRRPSEALSTGQSSKRERHLRKAAFYAADSLTISSKFALTYADATAHELPIQSAMCFFDCSQVLAEWACTVQERVGRYLGVLGKEDIDYTQVPAIMLLEAEDVELLHKIEHICSMLEEKMVQQAMILARELVALDPAAAMSGAMQSPLDHLPGLRDCGPGTKILMVTAYMLEKAAVWPGKSYSSLGL